MTCPTCDGRGRYRIGPEDWPCPDCDETGEVRGVCFECGEPLRPGDDGDTCPECCEDIEQHGVALLDTRPGGRRARARERWLDACTLVNFALWAGRCTEARALLANAERAWRWYVAWDLACVR